MTDISLNFRRDNDSHVTRMWCVSTDTIDNVKYD